MTEEILKRVEECNNIVAEHDRLREIRNEILQEIEPIIKKNFKYSHAHYSGEKSDESVTLGYDTYTNNFWLFMNPKNLESSEILSTIQCIKQDRYINFFMNQNYITISQNDRGYDITHDHLIKLYNRPDRDKLLELILSGSDDANIALAILSNK